MQEVSEENIVLNILTTQTCKFPTPKLLVNPFEEAYAFPLELHNYLYFERKHQRRAGRQTQVELFEPPYFGELAEDYF